MDCPADTYWHQQNKTETISNSGDCVINDFEEQSATVYHEIETVGYKRENPGNSQKHMADEFVYRQADCTQYCIQDFGDPGN